MKLQDVRTASELAILRDQVNGVRNKLDRGGRITHLAIKIETTVEIDGKPATVPEDIAIPLTEAPDPACARIMQALGAATRAMLLRWVTQTNQTVSKALEQAGIADEAPSE